MANSGGEPDYKRLRDARISQNKAMMETLGLRHAAQDLIEMAAAAAPARRPRTHKQYATGPPRRSARLNGLSVQHKALPMKGRLGKVTAVTVEAAKVEEGEEEEIQQQEQEEDEQQQQQAVAVDEEVVPAPQDSESEGMGAVDDADPGSPAHSAGGVNGAVTRIKRVEEKGT